MSSWFKWKFESKIVNIEVLGNALFVLADDNTLGKIELSIRDIEEQFLDLGTISYESEVLLSKFNLETKQGTRNIREPFFVKNVKTNIVGKCDLKIIDDERKSSKIINTKHLGRRLFVGGNSNKTTIGFMSKYDTGCIISTISLEGLLKIRSRNV